MPKIAYHSSRHRALVPFFVPPRRRDRTALPCVMLIGLIVGYIAIALIEAAVR
ncbi:hypothetical protein J121_420 [Qipengyuania citrea LAMA 915]|uniref:Uncharacterized protein n=1 Tax=Qipengyuania citrea LAMA 915 TaxID=1306953 RepID=A0A0L1KFG3_9SPHN|nr:hypothetical protein [Qipengyuania citrea]KNH02636.1 hypothetical protein J121_420 [Qipengyuania citrea LAMA 915]